MSLELDPTDMAVTMTGLPPLDLARARTRDHLSPCVEEALYRDRNVVERLFTRLKQSRRIANRYDKLEAAFFAYIQLASVRIILRSIEPTA